jgi:transcriptional antiterminator RfaH
VAEENLLRQGYHVYLPRIHSSRRRNDRWVDTVEPLFPRYLFICVDAARHSIAPVRSTRGVAGLVRQGAQPAVVPDAVMAAVMQRADADTGLHRDDRPLFCAGDQIRLAEGPLAGLEGVFSEEDGERRVIVLLELLGKANKIRVKRDWVIPAA